MTDGFTNELHPAQTNLYTIWDYRSPGIASLKLTMFGILCDFCVGFFGIFSHLAFGFHEEADLFKGREDVCFVPFWWFNREIQAGMMIDGDSFNLSEG